MVWSGTRKDTTGVESSQWSSQPHVAEMPRQRAQSIASSFPAAVVGCLGLCVVALTSSGSLLVGCLCEGIIVEFLRKKKSKRADCDAERGKSEERWGFLNS